MAAFDDGRLNLTGAGEPEEMAVQFATPELMRVLGVEPFIGRGLTAEDGRPGAPAVAVLSYGLWQSRFGGNPALIGQSITLNSRPYEVIGVMPAGFEWHIRQRSGTGKPAALWTVLDMPTEGPAMQGRFLSVVARLKPGVSSVQAEAELKAIHARLVLVDPIYNKGFGAEIVPLREQFVGRIRQALLVLLGAVGFVLLIACANVANLMLARAAAREKEIALRMALGARRVQVIRQLLTESVLLAIAGSLLGLGIASWGLQALIAISPRDLVNLQGVSLNLTVLAWTMIISVLTGIVFGLAPAWEATRIDLNDALKDRGRGAVGHSERRRRLRGALVIGEVALALMLLISAGLLVKSYARMQGIKTGFITDHVLTMVMRLPGAKYKDSQIVAFFREATDRIKGLPGVRSVGIVNYLPLYGGLGSSTGFSVEGRPSLPPGEGPGTNVRVADSGYFGTMGIPLQRGRLYTEVEMREARHVVLISESLANQYFPGEDPLGKRISVDMFDQKNPTEIIGIVGDVRYDSLVNKAEPTVYFPHSELVYEFMTFVIRTDVEPTEVAPAARRELSAMDRDLPVSDIRTMSQVMSNTVRRARFNTLLLGLFAALATLLAAVGIFGVMNYTVTLRTSEIGIRMALGAQPERVLLMVLKQGLVLTLTGVCIGLIGAIALASVISGLLYGVEATDPATYTTIVLLLSIVSLIACYLPARRATRIDPQIAMRCE